MIATSAAYKAAIKNGSHQRVLIDMGNVVLTNEDISVSSGGLKFEDRFNEETELTFGATPSNSISIALINRDGFFNDYEFGKIEASVGVLTESSRYSRSGSVTVEIGNNGKRFVGQTISPYLLEDGKACKIQPDFAVRSIVVDDGTLYCFGASASDVMAFRMNSWDDLPRWNKLNSYDWSKFNPSYTAISVPAFNEHTKNKIESLIRDHKGIVVHDNVVVDFLRANRRNVYEYVKLGTFFAESDGILRKSIISLDADDQMVRLDEILIDDVGLRFPITLKNMVVAICRYAGVRFEDNDFINSDLVVESRPDDFDETTAREVLHWIAEAACAYAKFDRNGVLCFKWFEQTDAGFDEKTFSSFDPMIYEVSRINGLKIRNGNSYSEESYGSGNAYLIQSNPFLRPDDSASTFSFRRSANNPILDKVASLEPFYPSSGMLFGDFSVESGDIITVTKDGRDYSVPIYSASTSWNGSSMTNVENSGSKRRTIPSLQKREEYVSERSNYNASKAIGGLGGRTSALEEDITYARIDIDDQLGKILLIAGVETLDEIDGSESLKQAYIDIDGANAQILLKASQATVNALGERVSAAEIEIDGLNSEIILKADKVKIDAELTTIKQYFAGSATAAKMVVTNLTALAMTFDGMRCRWSNVDIPTSVRIPALSGYNVRLGDGSTAMIYAFNDTNRSCSISTDSMSLMRAST